MFAGGMGHFRRKAARRFLVGCMISAPTITPTRQSVALISNKSELRCCSRFGTCDSFSFYPALGKLPAARLSLGIIRSPIKRKCLARHYREDFLVVFLLSFGVFCFWRRKESNLRHRKYIDSDQKSFINTIYGPYAFLIYHLIFSVLILQSYICKSKISEPQSSGMLVF